MSCCATYTNLGCFGSCEPINTGILAPSTGAYTLFLEFNFGLTQFDYILDEDDEFIIPCPFNENYIYTFYITDSDGSQLNDTCYKFRTRLINGSSVSNTCGQAGDQCIRAISTVGVAGTTITIATLSAYTAFTVAVGNTTYVDGWTQIGDTITFTNGVVISDGDTIKILATKN